MARTEIALLFDLGGVVIDISFERIFAAWHALSNLDKESLQKRFAANDDYTFFERGEMNALTFFTLIADNLEIEPSYEKMREAWNAIFVGTFEQSVSLLKKLQNQVPLYAFSNTNSVHRDYLQKHYGDTLSLFDRVFYSCDIGYRKPDAAAYQFVANEMGVTLENIVFFDDSPTNIESAHAQGMQAVLISSPEDIAAALKEYELL